MSIGNDAINKIPQKARRIAAWGFGIVSGLLIWHGSQAVIPTVQKHLQPKKLTAQRSQYDHAYHAMANLIQKAPDGNAYAQELQTRVPGVDYEFKCGVYEYGAPNFPENRYKILRMRLSKESQNDLHFIFDQQDLYQAFGKYLVPAERNGTLLELNFPDLSKKHNNEFSVTFEISGKYFIAFDTLTPKLKQLFLKYNIE